MEPPPSGCAASFSPGCALRTSLVLLEVNSDEREHLITAEPGTFHYTAHYANHPAILARLETVHPGSLRKLLERRWRAVAPKNLIKAHDGS